MKKRKIISETPSNEPANLKKSPPEHHAAMKGAISYPDISMNKYGGSPYLQYRFGIALAGAPDVPTRAFGAMAGDPLLCTYTDAEVDIINAAAKMVGAGPVRKLSSSRSEELSNTNTVSPVAQWNKKTTKKKNENKEFKKISGKTETRYILENSVNEVDRGDIEWRSKRQAKKPGYYLTLNGELLHTNPVNSDKAIRLLNKMEQTNQKYRGRLKVVRIEPGQVEAATGGSSSSGGGASVSKLLGSVRSRDSILVQGAPPSSNPVAKNVNATVGGGGSGAHRDRKKSEKRGERPKHKVDYRKMYQESHPGGTAGITGASGFNTAGKGWGSQNTRIAEKSADYDEELGMAENNLDTILRDAENLLKMIKPGIDLPEWCREKLAVVKSMMSTVSDYIASEVDLNIEEGDVIHHKFALKQAQKNKTPYRHTPVPKYDPEMKRAYVPGAGTAEPVPFEKFEVVPSPARPGMSHVVGHIGGKRIALDFKPNKEAEDLVNSYNRGGFSDTRSKNLQEKKKKSLRNPKDNPCWKGYHPVGTKKKGGRTVPNCVPKESVEQVDELSKDKINQYYHAVHAHLHGNDDSIEMAKKRGLDKRIPGLKTAVAKLKGTAKVPATGEGVEEKMMPRSNFAGVTEPPYNKLGSDAHLKGSMKRPARAGDLVGGGAEESIQNEAPIEMNPEEPMNPLIRGHQHVNPATLKGRIQRATEQLADLAKRAENASPRGWQNIEYDFRELAMNIEQIRHALKELANLRRKGGVQSRGIDPNIDEDMKTLDRSVARPGNPKTEIDPETGERVFTGYRDYNPTDKGKHERWAIIQDIERNQARLAAQLAAKKKAVKRTGGHKPVAAAGFSTSDRGGFLGGGKPYRRGQEESAVNEFEDPYLAELNSKLSEKIPANAPVDVWIKDFEKSTAPQFKGKSKAKRRQMAVAASYGAKTRKKKKK